MMQETTRRQRQPEARLLQAAFEIQDRCGFAAGDVNLHRYVGNNPTNMTDPSGLEGEWLKPDDYGKWALRLPGAKPEESPAKHTPLATWKATDGTVWELRLKPVTPIKEPTMKDMILLRQKFPLGVDKKGWTFTLAGKQTLSAGSLRVNGYTARVDEKFGHPYVDLYVEYRPGAKDPKKDPVHWIQFIDMNAAAADAVHGHPAVRHIIDIANPAGMPDKTATPYYPGTATPEGFVDQIRLPAPPPPLEETFRLFVVEETAAKTVRIWQGLTWGYTYSEKKKYGPRQKFCNIPLT
jgi:hypothetical protein